MIRGATYPPLLRPAGLRSDLRGGAGRALVTPSVSRLKVNRFVAAARTVAGVLVGALLLFELLAANSGFHQALHHGAQAASSSCVLCLFAKGQVDLPESAPVVTASVPSSSDPRPWVESIALFEFMYLASLSRAPPSPASRLWVVA